MLSCMLCAVPAASVMLLNSLSFATTGPQMKCGKKVKMWNFVKFVVNAENSDSDMLRVWLDKIVFAYVCAIRCRVQVRHSAF